jgi:hypothetical protein|tara:strand:+ start:2655 stop:2969 length:315 start_codon:yes stop_codon:yes gene_type:complete
MKITKTRLKKIIREELKAQISIDEAKLLEFYGDDSATGISQMQWELAGQANCKKLRAEYDDLVAAGKSGEAADAKEFAWKGRPGRPGAECDWANPDLESGRRGY